MLSAHTDVKCNSSTRLVHSGAKQKNAEVASLARRKNVSWYASVQANERRQQLLEAERRKQEAAQRQAHEEAARKAAEDAAAQRLLEEKERKDRAETDRKQVRSLGSLLPRPETAILQADVRRPGCSIGAP